MKKKMYMRIFLTAAGLAAFFLMGDKGSAKEEGKTITVAYTPAKGLSEIDEKGYRSGVVFDYLEEIAKYTGWKYEYKEVKPEDAGTLLQDGTVDLLGGMFYRPENEDIYDIAESSIGYNEMHLLTPVQRYDINSYNPESLQGKKIGVNKRAKEAIRRLNSYLEFDGIQCEIIAYDKFSYALNSLEQGKIDLVLGNDYDKTDQLKVVASFESEPYYFAVSNRQEGLTEELNQALAKIMEVTPDFIEMTHNRNYQSDSYSSFALTQEELAYVSKAEPVRVAIVSQWHPLTCTKKDVTHKGITLDVLNRIAERTGLRFTYVLSESYEEAMQTVLYGKADMLGAFINEEAIAEEYGMVLSVPYTDLGIAVVKNMGVNYPSKGLTAAMERGKRLPEGVEAENHLYYDTLNECIKAVNKGEVDIACALTSSTEEVLAEYRYHNVFLASAGNMQVDVAFAFAQPMPVTLFSIVGKALNSISETELTAIKETNDISLSNEKMSLLAVVYAKPFASLFVLFLFCMLTGLIVFVIIRGKNKAKVMQLELEKAELSSLAKTEFLSNMSHEIRTPMNAIVGLTNLAIMSKEATPAVGNYLDKIYASSLYLLALLNDILDMSKIEKGKLELLQESFLLRETLDALEIIVQTQADEKGVHTQFCTDIRSDALIGDAVRVRQVLTNLLSNALKNTERGDRITQTVKEIYSDKEKATFYFAVEDSGRGIAKEDWERIFEPFEQASDNFVNNKGTGLGLAISKNIIEAMGGCLQLESEIGEGAKFFFTLTFLRSVMPSEQDCVFRKEDYSSLEGMRVLLAEDNDINAEITTALLATVKIATVCAKDGKEAQQLFEKSPQGYYQMILMDIQMPVMNGLEAAGAIRSSSHPDAAGIPIVAMTANSFQEDKDAAEEAGMNDFVSKPVNREKLLQVMMRFLIR